MEFQLIVKVRPSALSPLATVAKVDLKVAAEDVPGILSAGAEWLEANQEKLLEMAMPAIIKAAQAQAEVQAKAQAQAPDMNALFGQMFGGGATRRNPFER